MNIETVEWNLTAVSFAVRRESWAREGEVSSQASIFRIPPIVFRFVADTDIFTHFIYSKNIENQDGQDWQVSHLLTVTHSPAVNVQEEEVL